MDLYVTHKCIIDMDLYIVGKLKDLAQLKSCDSCAMNTNRAVTTLYYELASTTHRFFEKLNQEHIIYFLIYLFTYYLHSPLRPIYFICYSSFSHILDALIPVCPYSFFLLVGNISDCYSVCIF